MGGGYVGVIDFVNISKNACEFGIYANPELKSQGKILMELMINHAKNALCVKQIKGYAYNFNQKAIALYEKFGFKLTARDSEFTHFCLDLEH
ncbi:GNAT family N-acetyltransferase [Campylobacter sp. PS10]|uniref:GNAT family N-acetyltransferase n=1 Tax=Campylobacter gastrosuis TaxID=2974576 RepID=A0ABT7HPN7_9BACT|nr:GNAT family N-acetyltransferase [Campylobacter gastrosuis]